MKINLPITNIEYTLSDTDFIVTKTDLKGLITYANDDFVQISGFSRKELLGSSHNIIRHPDMPTELFADLWQSMKIGVPWTAVVKNRCKNGNFYWVLANVTPYYENDQLAGYMSVRTKPSQKQINVAENAYKKFRDGKAGHLIIREGKIVNKTSIRIWSSMENISIKARISIIIAVMAALPLMVGAMSILKMDKTNERLYTLHEQQIQPSIQISQLQQLVLSSQLRLAASLLKPTAETIQNNTAAIEQNIYEINQFLNTYLKTASNPAEQELVRLLKDEETKLLTTGLRPAIEALRNNDLDLASQIIETRLTPLYESLNQQAQKLSQYRFDDTRSRIDASRLRYYSARDLASILIVSSIILALWLSFSLLHSILSRLNMTVGYFNRIAQGDYSHPVSVQGRDEVGRVMAALKAMQIKLGYDVAETQRVANEHLRIKIALDNVSTGVVLADNDRQVVHVNKALSQLFGQFESEIRKQVADFSATGLVGSRLDELHKGFTHKLMHTDPNTGASTLKVGIGGYSMDVVVSQVIDPNGKLIGSVAEWVDRTAEVKVENEVASILIGAVMGDFSKRIEMQGKTGFYRELSESINQLMQTSETGLNETVRVFNALSHGDLSQKIINDYTGTFGQLKQDANSTVDDLNSILGQIKAIGESIHVAAKEIAHGNTSLSHRTEEQATSLNQTTTSMQELTLTVQQNSENAKHASELAVSASDTAGRGVTVIGQVVSMMEGINESSRKVVEIISVIDSIAFQTNILALNAAVEAARAGDQGRGFAVVAGEVRNLAQRAASAAGEIKKLIGDSVEKVEDGSKLVSQAGKTMEDIVNSIRGVTQIMSEISAASIEQTSGIEQVNMAICQMDDVTQQNAALVEKASASAESLEEQTQHLTVAISHFKVNGDDGASMDSEPDDDMVMDFAPVGQVVKLDLQSGESGGWEEF